MLANMEKTRPRRKPTNIYNYYRACLVDTTPPKEVSGDVLGDDMAVE